MRHSSVFASGALVVLGGAVGAFVHSLSTRPGVSASTLPAPSPVDDEASSELIDQLRRLESAMERLNLSVQILGSNAPRARLSDPPEEPERPAVSERKAVPPPPSVGSSAGQVGWTDHLPKALTAVLVEHGVTPFDDGVSLILPRVADQLRAVERVHDEAMAELASSIQGVTTTGHPRFQEWASEQKQISRIRKDATDRIVEVFRAEIRDLVRVPFPAEGAE